MSFGSMPSGPAVSGTCFFAFVSKKHGEPPSIPAIQFVLNRARFEAHARIVLFLAVNTVVLDFLHSIPELAVIASFPTHTVHLECPAVWWYGKSKKTSKYPFALCVWQSRGFCKLNESDKKLTERALLRAGILQVSRKAQFHRDEFDRIWLGLKQGRGAFCGNKKQIAKFISSFYSRRRADSCPWHQRKGTIPTHQNNETRAH